MLGNLLYNYNLIKYDIKKINLIDKEQPLVGVIVSDAKTSSKNTQYKIHLIVYDFNIILKTPYNLYEYGDKVKFDCKFKINNIPDYYLRYLNKERAIIDCFTYNMELISKANANNLILYIKSFKKFFKNTINKNLSEPYGSFLSGLFIGGNSDMSRKIINAFKRTGTSHLVAVSGYNVSLVVNYLIILLGLMQLNKKFSFIMLTVGLILFNLITGFEPSITRAVLMGWTMVFSKYLGRYVNFRSLILHVGLILVLCNPFILKYDIGFQLSFLATIFLVYFTPFLISIFKIESISNEIVKNISLGYLMPTLSAYIGTFPIIAYNFKVVSYVAIIVNILVSPLIPLAMFFGFLMIVFTFIAPISLILSSFTWLILFIIIKIINFFSSFSWAMNSNYSINFITYALYYLVIITLIKIYDYIKKAKK